MDRNDQNMFERLASFFHHEISDDKNMAETQKESEIIEDADFNAVKKIYDVKDLVGEAATISHSDKAWQKVHSRIRRKRLYNNIVYWKYAAIIMVIFITAGLFLGKTLSNYFSEPEQFISIVTPNGKIKNLKLPDGTEVWINSGSLLKYSNPFDRANRHIILEGEAYFEVVKEGENPFTVSVGLSKVIVHGTKFDVKSYLSERKCEVILVEGSVEYVNSEKNVFIKPGERLTETRDSRELEIDHVNTANYTSWKSGKVYFDHQSLIDLVSLLEKWYGVKFEFANKDIPLYTFTGVIIKNNSLDYTLQIIEMTNKVKFVKKGGTMLITN
jgi:ferric-dicitrate binding protein FerR (iron transport regulator)